MAFWRINYKKTVKLYNISIKTTYSKTYSYSDVNAHYTAMPNLGNLQCSYKLWLFLRWKSHGQYTKY